MFLDRSAVAAIILLVSTISLNAQQGYTAQDVPQIDNLAPLSEYLSRPEHEQIPFYPFQRCAGLFLGYKYYAGATFDEQTMLQVDMTMDRLRIVAAFLELERLAQRRGESMEELPPELFQEVSAKSALQIQGFSFFYADRMETNYLTEGAAFSEDQLISGDLALCESFAEQAQNF